MVGSVKLYNVYIRCAENGAKGVITAPNYSAASRKAQTLYGRHAWVQPKEQQSLVRN